MNESNTSTTKAFTGNADLAAIGLKLTVSEGIFQHEWRLVH
jgi:hypothetical protein